MADNFNHDVDTIGGRLIFAASLLGTVWNYLANWFSLEKLNTALVLIATVLAILYTWHKYKGQRIQNKIKQIELDKLEEKQKEEEGEL